MALRVRWRGLELPVQVRVNQETLTDTYGEFVAEPFERGFGHSIGNSLRRVLLSSIEGSAIVAVRFDGIQQELSTIEGVLEDVPEIVLNMKEIVLRLHADEQRILRVEATGPGIVTASHIVAGADVEAVDTSQIIATLTDEVDFGCEIFVRRGRGYVPSEEHDGLPGEIGMIPVDGLFSPVRRVSYEVEETRVGRRTNYDRLILKVTTSGVVSPEMAVVEAAKILRKHMNPFVQYFELGRQLPHQTPESEGETKQLDQPEIPESKLSMPLDVLQLSTRAAHCLETAGIKTVEDLLRKSKSELLALRNFGDVTLVEVAEKLAEHDLAPAMLALPEPAEDEPEDADADE
jgi:DNA-directed RNA polymerase subunit alpha